MVTTNIRDIRRIYDIYDVLRRAGVEMRKRWGVCPLPMHQHRNNTPSFSVFTGSDGVQRFQCHGNCGARGDVIDLAGYLWVLGYNPSDPKDVHRAIEALQTRNDFVFPTSEISREPTLSGRRHLDFLPIGDRARSFARDRGLNDETIDHFQLGQDGRYLTIPTFHDGRLMAIKKRALFKTKNRFFCEEGSKMSLFNHDAVAYAQGTVLYIKGEIPAMLLCQMGYLACAPATGEESFDPAWATLLAFADVLVIGDNDEAGVRTAGMRAIDLSAKLKFPPAIYKDIDEYILAEPKAAGLALEEWVHG